MALSAAQRRMRRLADSLLGRLTAQIEIALDALLASVGEERLTEILRRRDAVALHDLVSGLPARLRPAGATLSRAFDAGARAGAQMVGIRLSFVSVDRDAVAFARSSSARFVRQITEETRQAIRVIMTKAFTDGLPPREAAKRIRLIVGLTERQARSVYAHVEQAIDDGLSRADAIAEGRLIAGQLRHKRAITIARTETIRASAEGQQAAWRAATNRGLLPLGAKKVWITTPDDRLCPICEPLDGESVPLDASFETDLGRVGGPPVHPNCRCALGVSAPAVRRAA